LTKGIIFPKLYLSSRGTGFLMEKINYFKLKTSFLVIIFCFFIKIFSPNEVLAFNEDFNSYPLDNNLWEVKQNAGNVTLDSGFINLSAGNTTTFPFIFSKSNFFPESEDFSIKLGIKYSNATSKGTGVIFSTELPINNTNATSTSEPLFSKRHFLGVWQDSIKGFSIWYCGDCYNISCSSEQFFVYKKIADLGYHDIEFKYSSNKYYIYVDGNEVFQSNPTNVRPSYIWLGNPTIQGSGHIWTSFLVDYIRIESNIISTPTSTPIPTATPTPIPTPTPTPTPTPLQPIIILPGLGASWNHENMILGIEKPQSDWFMTPGVKVYDGLITTLKNAGYQIEDEDKNLFVFNYNWTKPIESSVEDFKNYINNVVKPLPEQKIDLIGHSLGGLIARVYVQNNPDNNVDQLITLGSPHKGIPSLYYLWEGGDLGKSLPAWQRIGAGLLVHLRKPGFSTTMEAIRSIIPSLKNLLPTFNYLKENSIEKSLDIMTEKNDWLININTNLPAHLFNGLHTIAGVTVDNTLRWINITNRNWLDKILGLWIDGKPKTEEKNQGDWTVLAESAILPGGKTDNLNNFSHMELVTSPVVQQKIMEYLGLSPSSISETSASLNYDSALIFQIASPAKIDLFDSYNNPIGSGDGKLMIIPNPKNDQYQIKLTGTDQGQYKLYVGWINNQEDNWQTIFGDINLNEEDTYKLDLDNASPEIVITSEDDNLYSKNAQTRIKELKDHVSLKGYGRITTKIILASLSIINHSLEKNKIKEAIIGLYQVRYQISLLEKSKNLNRSESIYLKNKVMEIINDLEINYLQTENNKNKKHQLFNLKQEIKITQRIFGQMEKKLKNMANRNNAETEYGTIYLLAQAKLNKALDASTPSLEAYINTLGARYLSGEFIFFK
jgi:pimeloyl-ACP methyl ester carboxylesterase